MQAISLGPLFGEESFFFLPPAERVLVLIEKTNSALSFPIVRHESLNQPPLGTLHPVMDELSLSPMKEKQSFFAPRVASSSSMRKMRRALQDERTLYRARSLPSHRIGKAFLFPSGELQPLFYEEKNSSSFDELHKGLLRAISG